MSCAQAHWVGSKPKRRVRQLKLLKPTMAIGYSLRMYARHVDSTNPGRSNLVGLFRSNPIAEAEMSNRLIGELSNGCSSLGATFLPGQWRREADEPPRVTPSEGETPTRKNRNKCCGISIII